MNVVIAAGGTGGHVFPAVALAEEFCRQDPKTSITVVGTGKTLEDTMLAGSPFHLETIHAKGVVGKGLWASLTGVILVPHAIWQAIRLLHARCADLVIGTGGYTSPPVVIAAFLLGIRRALLEPNAIPGLANRMLGPLAQRIFVSFDTAQRFFNPSKTRTIGVPIRKAFREYRPAPPRTQVKTLLVCGGSQGAQAINTAVIEAFKISAMIREHLSVIHQTGSQDYGRVCDAYRAAGVSARVMPFFTDMPSVLYDADLVVSRCGALTLAELAACGKAAILIPFPYATHNHQEINARVVEQAEAGVVILQRELTPERLVQEIEVFVRNPERVKIMGERSLTLRRMDSAKIMVQECRALVESR